MTFLATIAGFAAVVLALTGVPDPTFRPDHDAGHWRTVVVAVPLE